MAEAGVVHLCSKTGTTDEIDEKELSCKISIDNDGSILSNASKASRHWVIRMQNSILNLLQKHKRLIKISSICGTITLYFIYFGFAIAHDFEKAIPLVAITSLVLFCIIYVFIRDTYGENINKLIFIPVGLVLEKNWNIIKWFLYGGLSMGVVYYLLFIVITSIKQLQSLVGMVLCIMIPWFTSKHPSKINWRPVVWGLGLQFALGVLVLRWKPGYEAVKWLAREINTYIFYSLAGSAAIFGDPTFVFHAFLMLVVPLVVWVGVSTTLAFHMGLIQLVATKLGWLMKKTFQTTAIESISLVVNIFLSVLDSMIMLKQYIPKLTKSEFHCFLVGAHSTIAGFAFGLFVLFGVNPQHLLTGAVMSAPAAVAIAKLNYPETEQSQLLNDEDFDLGNGGEANIAVAGAKGAYESGKSAATILIQVIAFVSLIVFMDDVVIWFGLKVGWDISLAKLFAYLFIPITYLLGVDAEDLDAVAGMLGLKVVANEFLGFILLGRYERNDTISDRSAAIATYAMCGFSSFGTFAIFTGVWNTVDPKRTTEVSSQIPRLMLNSNLACFTTACIASIFYNEDIGYIEDKETPVANVIFWILESAPTYDTIFGWLGLPNY